MSIFFVSIAFEGCFMMSNYEISNKRNMEKSKVDFAGGEILVVGQASFLVSLGRMTSHQSIIYMMYYNKGECFACHIDTDTQTLLFEDTNISFHIFIISSTLMRWKPISAYASDHRVLPLAIGTCWIINRRHTKYRAVYSTCTNALKLRFRIRGPLSLRALQAALPHVNVVPPPSSQQAFKLTRKGGGTGRRRPTPRPLCRLPP